MSTQPGSISRTGVAPRGERAVPYHCPYCAEEDLRPLGATPGAWHCRACTRTFSVKYLGMQAPTPTWPNTLDATPTPSGGTP
jgi:ribosomal protein L37AE/L43A